MTEDKKAIWAKSQLRDSSRERRHRERAQAVKNTRNTADRYLAGGRINREALNRGEEE